MTLETLKERIEQFLQLDRELYEIGKHRSDDIRGFLQADALKIAKYAKEHKLETEIKPRDCDTYPWMITVPEIKMYGVARDVEMQEIKALIEEKAVETDA